MSRSYKKTPHIRQEKEDYRYLNRQIRHDKLAEIPNGSYFKKFGPHCNDWNYIWTWEEAEKNYKDYYANPHLIKAYTFEEWKNYWSKCAKRK